MLKTAVVFVKTMKKRKSVATHCYIVVSQHKLSSHAPTHSNKIHQTNKKQTKQTSSANTNFSVFSQGFSTIFLVNVTILQV